MSKINLFRLVDGISLVTQADLDAVKPLIMMAYEGR